MKIIFNIFCKIVVRASYKTLLKFCKISELLFLMVKMMMKWCQVELCLLYKVLNGKKWNNSVTQNNKLGKYMIILKTIILVLPGGLKLIFNILLISYAIYKK